MNPLTLLGCSVASYRTIFPSTATEGSVIPQDGLSLWLKADAGVTTTAYTYKSNITLSEAGESSINGSYTAGDPGSSSATYVMSGPNNNRIEVRPNSSPIYRLYNLDNYTNPNPWFYSFNSTNGSTWTAVGKKPVSIVLSGLTGASSTSNGTYSAFEWEPGNGSFISYKSVGGGVDTNVVVEIYPNGSATAFILSPEFFISAEKPTGWGIGSWDLVEGTGSPVGTGTLYPTGGVPTGVVTTTNVVTPNVTNWADQSGNGNNAVGSDTLPTLQSNAINGYPAIRFNNTESAVSRFTVSNNFNLKNSSVFIVVKQLNLDNAFPRMLSFLGANNDYDSDDGLAFVFNNTVPQLQVESNSNNAVIENLVANNVFALASYKIDNSGNISVFYNGASEGTGQNANMTSQNSGGAIYIGQGSQNITAAGLYGDIAEVILYNSNLTTPQRQQVETYLNAKYAIY